MEFVLGIIRSILPRRYWAYRQRGCVFSIFLTALGAVILGLPNFLVYLEKSGNEAASLVIKVSTPGARIVAGLSPEQQSTAAILSVLNAPFAFFFSTPIGFLSFYLFVSAVFRGLTLAGHDAWGDPSLTILDRLARGVLRRSLVVWRTARRNLKEGPKVGDLVMEGRQFGYKEVDYVVVSSRRKEGWAAGVTVYADSCRMRIEEPFDRRIGKRLRVCYPLRIVRDNQIDRIRVAYQWPADAPPLPEPTDA